MLYTFQDKVVAFQAFAEYEILLKNKDLDLDIKIFYDRNLMHHEELKKDHAELQISRSLVG